MHECRRYAATPRDRLKAASREGSSAELAVKVLVCARGVARLVQPPFGPAAFAARCAYRHTAAAIVRYEARPSSSASQASAAPHAGSYG